jgi:hypothetical protein
VYPSLTAALLCSVCLTPAAAQQKITYIDQGQSDPRLRGYLTPEGIKVEVVAEGRLDLNFLAMAFDADGKLYVLKTSRTAIPKGKDTSPIPKGSVKLLSLGQKGVYDQEQILVAMDDDFPISLFVHDESIFVTSVKGVRRYPRNVTDGAYDKRLFVAGGEFATSLTLGNNGWLYLTASNPGFPVKGADGWPDARTVAGGVFRFRLQDLQLQMVARGIPVTWCGMAFDANFHPFVGISTSETTSQLMHVPEGTDVRKLPALHKTRRSLAGGLLIYHDTHFPVPYRGAMYFIDYFGHSVRGIRVEPSGATFEVTQEFELLKSSNPAFGPRHLALGPDGAIYVGDGRQGRIYRLSWTGTKEHPALPLRPMDSWAKIIKLPDAELIKALAREDFSDRQYAQREIVRSGVKNRPALLKLLADDGQPLQARIAALGALQSFWNDEVQAAFVKALNDAQSDIRRLAADALGLNATRRDAMVHEALARELNATDLAVRRSVFLAIGKVGAPGAADTLGNALKADDGKDVFLRDGLVRAIEHLGKAGVEELLALADSGVDSNRDKVVEVFQATRTKPAYDALPTVLRNMHLSPTQKAGLVRSYANYQVDPPVSLEPLVDWLRKLPEPADAKKRAELVPVKVAGMEVLARGGPQYAKQLSALKERWLKDEDAGIRRMLTDALREIRERK